MKFKQIKLANELEIIAEINDNARSVALGFFVRAGSRDETPAIYGGSHFLEHMVFKGTKTRTAEEVNRQLDDLGGHSNACTNEEMTVYFASVLPELLEPTTELLVDLMQPILREDDFEMERQVILEEIRMYDDQPPFGLDEKARELFFGSHPLAKSVLGTEESITQMTIEAMRNYQQRAYAPNNIVVAACGNIDFDKLVRDLDRLTASWRPIPIHRDIWRPTGKKGEHYIRRAGVSLEYLFGMNDAPAMGDKERFAAAILANIIGDDVGSRFYWMLVDNGLADTASFSYCEYQDAGFFNRFLCCSPESVQTNLDIMNGICLDVQKNGVKKEELKRAKNKILSRIVLGSELPRGRLFAVGGEWLQNGEYYSVTRDLDIVRSVSLDDLLALLEKYPLDDPLIAAIGPV